ncbi:hypothetical protein H1C71_021557 [Ictidomys tridecemlineatus]|nr:hypothetical protein H1C71_021557 [Ictidomys tridecemlineatus]KAG3268581.1 hypothetical protein H1C71_021557 [Ictidomys tridecemlineatus]
MGPQPILHPVATGRTEVRVQTPEPVLITPEIPRVSSELTHLHRWGRHAGPAAWVPFFFLKNEHFSCSLHVCPAFVLWFQNHRAVGPKATTPPTPYTHTRSSYLLIHIESQGANMVSSLALLWIYL